MTKRLAAFVAVSLLAALGAAQVSAAGEIRRVDTSRYPLVRVRVVAPHEGIRPSLSVDGQQPVGLTKTNLGARPSIVLAVDRSRSMAGKPLAAAVAALRRFVEQKRQLDQIEIVAFGSSAQALTGFEGATIDADIALRTLGVDAHQGTALYDAVALSASELAGQPRVGRTLILLTDGAVRPGCRRRSDLLDGMTSPCMPSAWGRPIRQRCGRSSPQAEVRRIWRLPRQRSSTSTRESGLSLAAPGSSSFRPQDGRGRVSRSKLRQGAPGTREHFVFRVLLQPWPNLSCPRAC